ncbi:hypothetical protein [uncultured Bacteroides sp.]|nr:hypothetical protein [uncultured Bacteroides sp.]
MRYNNDIYQEGIGKSTPSEYNQANPVPGYVMEDIAHWIQTGKIDEK